MAIKDLDQTFIRTFFSATCTEGESSYLFAEGGAGVLRPGVHRAVVAEVVASTDLTSAAHLATPTR